MTRRHYGQACSIATALDRVGERWSLLIVRELLLGPLRFTELARGVGGAPSDVLTRRLRDLEADGIVRRRELAPPASGVVYELTEIGQRLESTIVELGRWGLNFYEVEDIVGIDPAWLPGALRVLLQPPPEAALTLQLHSEGHSYWLRIEDGAIAAERGEAASPDVVLRGSPAEVLTLLVTGGGECELEGDAAALATLRAMVVLPERLRAAAAELAGVATPA